MKKILAAFISVGMVLCLMSAITAFALGPTNITWLQGSSPSTAVQSIYANTNAIITFEGVATSSSSGSFKVKLQYKNWLGNWTDDTNNNIYTVQQHSNQTYNSRTGHYVTGQYFKLLWTSHGNHDYRVVLYDPSNPQVTYLQDIYLY